MGVVSPMKKTSRISHLNSHARTDLFSDNIGANTVEYRSLLGQTSARRRSRTSLVSDDIGAYTVEYRSLLGKTSARRRSSTSLVSDDIVVVVGVVVIVAVVVGVVCVVVGVVVGRRRRFCFVDLNSRGRRRRFHVSKIGC